MDRYILFDFIVAGFVFLVGFVILYGSLHGGFESLSADISNVLQSIR